MIDLRFIATYFLVILVYLGLAVYVITRNPRRPNSWVFGACCLLISIVFTANLFLFPAPGNSPPLIPFPLRVKWLAVCLIPPIYFHLVSDYFSGAWRFFHSPRFLAVLYFVSLAIAGNALLGDWLLTGAYFRLPDHIIGPAPGPLMPIFAVFFATVILAGTLGLVVAYRSARSTSVKAQILQLLTPTLILFVGSLINWALVLTRASSGISVDIANILTILAAFFFARAILQHGFFVGSPSFARSLVSTLVATALIILILIPAIFMDQVLITRQVTEYPFVTGLLVVVVAISFPFFRAWFMPVFERFFDRNVASQLDSFSKLAQGIKSDHDPERWQAELLSIACSVLGVRGGYLGLSEPETMPGTAMVRSTSGEMGVKPGDRIHLPALSSTEPQLVTVLPFHEIEGNGLQDVAVVCRLTTTQGRQGFLALAGKSSQKPFTQEELSILGSLARQVEVAMDAPLRPAAPHSGISARNLPEQTIRETDHQISTPGPGIFEHSSSAVPELHIDVLGPLQVFVGGQRVAESDWGSEKAKGLLAYLLWKGAQGAGKDEILFYLWPDLADGNANNVFHVTMNRLRRVLAPGPGKPRESKNILHQGSKYRFNFDSAHPLDVAFFQECAAGASPEALKRAVSLYRGPYLEDVSWALPAEVEIQRRIYELMYESVLRRLIDVSGGSQSEIYMQKLLAVEPADEATWSRLVGYYLRNGRQQLARQQVVRWEKEWQTMELSPSPEILSLWSRVKTFR